MCPMERDRGGKIPQVLVEYKKGGLRMVAREERARKLGIEVRTQSTMALPPNPVKVEGDKFHIPPTNPDPSVYTVGSMEDNLGGLSDLNGKALDDKVREDNPKGADLIIYTALPGTFDEEDAGIWQGVLGDDKKYPVPDKKKVTERMELTASLIAWNGLVLMIAPFGCPPGGSSCQHRMQRGRGGERRRKRRTQTGRRGKVLKRGKRVEAMGV
jgi:hypothetical protein